MQGVRWMLVGIKFLYVHVEFIKKDTIFENNSLSSFAIQCGLIFDSKLMSKPSVNELSCTVRVLDIYRT